MFFLPLISYEDHQISNFFKGALAVLAVSLAQISYLQVEDFCCRRLKTLTMLFRAIGYWIEVTPAQISATVLGGEIVTWNNALSAKALEKLFIVTSNGRYYRKVAFRGSFLPMGSARLGRLDRLIIVILKGTALTRRNGLKS